MTEISRKKYRELNGSEMTEKQIGMYLERIEMDKPEIVDLEYLTRLQFANVSHIPYENLDMLAGKEISLDREHLFEKIIVNGRGGVCSETNTLYNWLLESLGYDTVSYNSRIISKASPVQMTGHRVIGVDIDGISYITDVGVNYEHHRIPLRLAEGLVQNDEVCDYQFKKDDFFGWVLWQQRPGTDWRRKLGFTENPNIDPDYIQALYMATYHEGSKFNKTAKVSQYIDGEFFAIREREFFVEHNGIPESICTLDSKEEERQKVREIFGLEAEY